MFAVAIDLRECWTGALRREAPGRELNVDTVGRRIGTPDLAASRGLVDLDVVDRVTPHVVIASQKGSRTEQAPQRSIVERGDRFVKGCGQARVRTPDATSAAWPQLISTFLARRWE
jgi:hypothetical protein